MKGNPLASLLSLLLTCFYLVQPALAKETITWLEATFPPFLIHEGSYTGQGYGDTVTDIITKNLQKYNHERIKANISRHYRMFKQGENVCTVGLYKTPERNTFVYFSIPSFFTLPNVIVINKTKYQEWGGRDQLSLAEILKNNDLVIGRSKNRSYGPVIDSLLDKHGSEANIFEYEGNELSLNFFEMLKRDRLDGIIGLPEEVIYQAENLGIRDQIMTLGIVENQANLDAWLSYVACSKTPWGKKVIEDIDQVLIEERSKQTYRAAYERWLDEGSIRTYRNAYDQYFIQIKE
ncbi:MAG: TIGR02285 family protein [Desulfocapsaceae bacterium]|nr:TIGR02285 family protein [Desulfocapsaceae bacterium]